MEMIISSLKSDIFKTYFKSWEDMKRWLHNQSKIMKCDEQKYIFSHLYKLLEVVINKCIVITQMKSQEKDNKIK